MSAPAQAVKQELSQPVTDSKQPEQTPQELLGALERTATEKIRALNDAKDQLLKAHDAVNTAHEASFKAFQTLFVNKEQFMMSIINNQQAKLKSLEEAAAKAADQAAKTAAQQAAQVTALLTGPSVARTDNVVSS